MSSIPSLLFMQISSACIFSLRFITSLIKLNLCSFAILFQFRPSTNTEETEVADACGCRVVLYDSYNNVCMAPVMVCLLLYTFYWCSFLHFVANNDLGILGWRNWHCVFSSIPPLWPLLALYLIWFRWIDEAPEKGGRSSQWFRSSRFWKYFADYYPAS